MPKEVLGEKLYTVEEVAEMIGVTKRTMTTYIQQGRLQGQKLAKRWYFSADNIKAFLQGKKPQQ